MTHATFLLPSQIEAEKIIEEQRQRIDVSACKAEKWGAAIATWEAMEECDKARIRQIIFSDGTDASNDECAKLRAEIVSLQRMFGTSQQKYKDLQVKHFELQEKSSKVTQLENKIASLEQNIELVIQQRDRSNKKLIELERKQIEQQLERVERGRH